MFQYIHLKNAVTLSDRVRNQLEMRYIFLYNDIQPNPYFETTYGEFNSVSKYLNYELFYSIDIIIEHFNMDKKLFVNPNKNIPMNSFFKTELNHLKKYLALAYIYDKQLHPNYINKDKYYYDIEYRLHLREYIATNEKVYSELEKLYLLLLIPHQTYEPINVYSKHYKQLFKAFGKRFSKWQTQIIMKRYVNIISEMEQPIPEIILDLVDEFLNTYISTDYNGKDIDDEPRFINDTLLTGFKLLDSFELYSKRVLEDIENTHKELTKISYKQLNIKLLYIKKYFSLLQTT